MASKNAKGRDVKTTYPGGAYIKVAFYGDTIGLDVYCSSSFPKRITFACYIDDSKEPIVKKLSDALGNFLIFSDSLKNLPNDKPHTAKIYVRSIQEENTKQNRFA
jgi:beta-mannanase